MWRRLASYVRTLPRPASLLELVELVSKTVVAAAAAIIAVGVWVYSEHKDALADQQRQQIEEQKDARERSSEVRDTIALFLNYTPKSTDDPASNDKINTLTKYCEDLGRARPADAAAAARRDGWFEGAGRWLSGDARAPAPVITSAGYSSGVVAQLCSDNRKRGEALGARAKDQAAKELADAVRTKLPGAYSNSAAGQAQSAALAAAESGGRVELAARWFAVIASVRADNAVRAPELAKVLGETLGLIGLPKEVGVYCTRLSRSVALTSGGPMGERAAKERARQVRLSGVVTDAFAQPDRDWVAKPAGADCRQVIAGPAPG